jgi:alkylation response protein AidB-like acyl-CoA dehydrogenase
VAEATAELDSAVLLLHHHFQDSMATVASGKQMTLLQRARGRRDGAYTSRVCNRALARLLDCAPPAVLYDSSPVQRAWRDIRVMSAHPALHFDSAGELWTTISYGLVPPHFADCAL